jgi:tetratricopeptide (TPR) repeat protein
MNRKITLRLRQRLAQPLFIVGAFFLGGLSTLAQPWPATITDSQGTSIDVQILRVEPEAEMLTYRRGQSESSVPFRLLSDVQFNELPDAFTRAEEQYQQNNLIVAQPQYETVLDLFEGLPVDFVGTAYTRLADIYIFLEKYEEAEALLEKYQADYGDAESEMDPLALGQAQIAVAKGEIEQAMELLEPLQALAVQQESVTREEAGFFARVFYNLAEAYLKQGNLAQALENYLKVSTIFYQDKALADVAAEKARELKADNPELHVP